MFCKGKSYSLWWSLADESERNKWLQTIRFLLTVEVGFFFFFWWGKNYGAGGKDQVLNNCGPRSWNLNHITLSPLVPDIYCCITTIPKITGVKL